MFITIMDSTIVNVALPTLRHQFGVSTASVSAVVTSYLVAVAVVMPASGSLGDRAGGKRVLLWALVGIAISSRLYRRIGPWRSRRYRRSRPGADADSAVAEAVG